MLKQVLLGKMKTPTIYNIEISLGIRYYLKKQFRN